MKQLSITFIFGLLFSCAQISIDSSSLPNVGYEVQIAIARLNYYFNSRLNKCAKLGLYHLLAMRTDDLNISQIIHPMQLQLETSLRLCQGCLEIS